MKIVLSFVLIITAFFLSGCLEIQTLVRVDSSGAGTIEETVLINSEIVRMIEQFSQSMPDSGQTPEEFNLFNEEELRSEAATFGEGVEYVSGKQISNETREGFSAVYSFTDINKLRINENPNSKIPLEAVEEEDEGDAEEELVQFQFTKGNPSELRINFMDNQEDSGEKDSASAESDSVFNDTTFNQVVNLLKDMKISLAVEPTGTITETNALHREGNKIILFDIDFNELLKDPAKLEKFKKTPPQDLENLRDIVKDIPGIKIELNQPLIIKYQ